MTETKKYFYYAVHVFYSTKNGFTVGVRSETELNNDQAIALAVREEKIDTEDAKSVDWVDQTDEEDYNNLNS